jgi:hypothetical protein
MPFVISKWHFYNMFFKPLFCKGLGEVSPLDKKTWTGFLAFCLIQRLLV